jgi:hypothetical protein
MTTLVPSASGWSTGWLAYNWRCSPTPTHGRERSCCRPARHWCSSTRRGTRSAGPVIGSGRLIVLVTDRRAPDLCMTETSARRPHLDAKMAVVGPARRAGASLYDRQRHWQKVATRVGESPASRQCKKHRWQILATRLRGQGGADRGAAVASSAMVVMIVFIGTTQIAPIQPSVCFCGAPEVWAGPDKHVLGLPTGSSPGTTDRSSAATTVAASVGHNANFAHP